MIAFDAIKFVQVNIPPTLSNGYVSPSSGDTSTTFSYYVTYSDPEGDIPTTKYVYIDGSPYTMTKISGDYVSGAVFRYSTTLSAGSHNYYFYFEDGHGHAVRLPTSGTYSGPSVSPPPQFDFTVGVSPSSGSVQQGGSVSSTVTVTLTSGSTQTVSLTTSGLPSGAYATFNPSSGYPTFTSTCTISTSTTTPTGTFYITIIGSGGGLTRTATYTLTVTPLLIPDFSISASPTSLTIQQGSSGSSTITINSINGFNQPVQLSVSGAPSGVTATLSPSQVTPPAGGTATSTLTVSVGATATPGSYTLTVTGTSGALTHNTYISLEITAAPPPPNQPPYEPTAASQHRSDGTTVIPEGGATPESTVVFKATVSDPDGDSVRLEIELRQIDEDFTGEPTPETISDFVLSGSQVIITRYSLVDGGYKWRYRAKDSKGATSSWVEFGTQGNIDFISSEDIYWLAKTIMSEASVGTSEEQAAVGWTVLNRLRSGRYENSIKGIVTSGQYATDQEPTRVDIVALAKDLLEGKVPDATDGATHFFSPRSMTSGYGPYRISGTETWVLIPSWAIPIGYTKASPPPPDWEITPFYLTIDWPTTEWISGLENVNNWYFMFYRPHITRIHARIESPGELRVYDSEGRVTGLLNGTVMIEIPGSDYFENTVTIFFPNDTYRYELVGTSEGVYGLTVTAVTRQENITFSAIDIPVSVEAIHQYDIDWAGWVALSQGEEGVTIMVDSDSDGIFEHTFASDSELTQSEFLAQMVFYTFSVVWEEGTFVVSVESNSTVSNFAFNQPDKEISFNVTGSDGTFGFCNVTIPKALLYAELGEWNVLIDGAPALPTITENKTHTSLYFTYTHSTHLIQIIGTWVVSPPDTTPPLIKTPFQQPEPDKVTPDQAVKVYVNVTDTESGVKNVILSYTTNGGATWNNLTMLYNATAGLYQATIPAFPSGTTICYKIIAYDNADNVAINDNAGQYYCYTVNPPAPPSLSVSISPLSASILVGQSVTFTSTVSGGYTPYTYQWYLNNNPASGATSVSWTFTPTASGIYYIYVKVTDDKGNTAQSDAARITVATVPVGGYSIPIQVPTKAEPIIPYITLSTIVIIALTTIKRKTTKKKTTVTLVR
jgi:hypothetical protein